MQNRRSDKGHLNPSNSDTDIDTNRLMRKIDKDGSGCINFEEFCKYFNEDW